MTDRRPPGPRLPCHRTAAAGTRRADPGRLVPPAVAFDVAALWVAAARAGLPSCPHPAAVWLDVGRAARLACEDCAAQAICNDPNDGRRCDACGDIAPLAGYAVALPRLVRCTAIAGLVAVGPAIALVAVCRVCAGAEL